MESFDIGYSERGKTASVGANDPLKNCKKIGIMGGTFNPIHVGHLMMGRFAKEFAGLDAVLFIPTGHPYMKDSSGLLDGRQRLHMVQKSIQMEPDFFASSVEIDRMGQTYTYETIEILCQKYPSAHIYFIMGADSLYSFSKWSHPERILSQCILIAAARNGSSMAELSVECQKLMKEFGGKILLMEFPAIDISSTMIRERVHSGKSIRYLTTDFVCDYIKENRLYL